MGVILYQPGLVVTQLKDGTVMKIPFSSMKQQIVALARKMIFNVPASVVATESHPDDIQLFFCCRLLFFQPGAQLGTDLEYGQGVGLLKTRRHFQTGRDQLVNSKLDIFLY